MRATDFLSRQKQRGIATVLIVVLLGFSLTITILVGLSKLRSTQELGVSLHSQTVTQQRAWSAAEALRQYFEQVTMDYTQWVAFLDGFDLVNNQYPAITMTGFEGLQAQFIGVDDSDPNQLLFSMQLTADTAPGTRVATKSALQMTYAVVPPTPAGGTAPGVPSRNVITFYDGLDVRGGIDIIPEAGQAYDVFVDGNVTLGSASLKGMDSILSTMSISYSGGSGTNFKLLHASCDIRIGSTSDLVQHAKATNNICFDGGPASSLIEANGFVSIDRAGNQSAIWSHANADGVASCAAGSTPLCSNNKGIKLSGGMRVERAYTRGSIESPHGIGNTAIDWRAENEITITSNCTNLSAAALNNMSARNGVPNCKPGASSVVVAPPVTQPVVLERETFDANEFRDLAHFVYHYHNNQIRVIVRGITGITDSEAPANSNDVINNGYYFRKINNSANYACPALSSPAADCWRLAVGGWDGADVVTYDNNNKRWTMLAWGGWGHAPGVIFFDGNAVVNGNPFTATVIATGNIVADTSIGLGALNYVGPDSRVLAGSNFSGNFQGVCSNNFGYSVTDLCPAGGYDPSGLSGLGNFALKAGSCPATSPGSCATADYIGGNIELKRSVFGVIKAGNIFTSSANTFLKGYVSALALGNTGTQVNKIGNRTVIDLSDLPKWFDPRGGATDTGDGGGDNGGGQGQAGSAKMLWTRYL